METLREKRERIEKEHHELWEELAALQQLYFPYHKIRTVQLSVLDEKRKEVLKRAIREVGGRQKEKQRELTELTNSCEHQFVQGRRGGYCTKCGYSQPVHHIWG